MSKRFPMACAVLAVATAFAGAADAAPRQTTALATMKQAPDPKAPDIGLVATVSPNATVDLTEWTPDRKWVRIAVEGKAGWVPGDKIKLLPEDMDAAKRAEAEAKLAADEAKKAKDAADAAEREAQKGAPLDYSALSYPEPMAEGRWRVVVAAAEVMDKDGKALGKVAVGHRVRVAGEAGDSFEILARDGETRGHVAKAALAAQDGVEPPVVTAPSGPALADDDPFAKKDESGKPKRERIRSE